MASVKLDNGKILIKLSALEKFASLKFSDLVISPDDIEYAVVGGPPRFSLRVRGANLGGRKIGFFRSEDGGTFFVVISGVPPYITLYLRDAGIRGVVLDSSVDGIDELIEFLSSRNKLREAE